MRGVWLGERRYEPVFQLQQRLLEARQRDEVGDTVLLLEHAPVITLGRGAAAANVLLSRERLAERGIELVESTRGGDVTLHAPGQLVGYPIVKLDEARRDVRRYVRALTEMMRRLAARFDIDGGRIEEWIGLWVDTADPSRWPGEHDAVRPAKLGAIGVRISRWVTMHGFAFNATTDLDLFSMIVPCGISAHGVTSVQQIRGESPAPAQLADTALRELADVLDRETTELEDWSSRDPGELAPR